MSAWLREIAGWVLLGIGLAMFAMCYTVFLLNGRVIQGFILAVPAVFVFRGGLQMLKVAMAARASRDIRKEIAASTVPLRKVRPQLGSQLPAGRERKSVLPGPGRK